MKQIITLAVLLLCFSSVYAKYVSEREAEQLGRDIYPFLGAAPASYVGIEASWSERGGDLPDFYILRFRPQGFILIAADDGAQPILGYSMEAEFPVGFIPAHVKWYFGRFSAGIREIRSHPEWAPDPDWALMRAGDFHPFQPERVGTPLCSTTWNQNWPYNSTCPLNQGGPGGHVYAGCVATAMAQVMKRWNFPSVGNGSHSYYAPGYGTQSVDFSSSTYDWAAMPDNITEENVNISTLLYHCGVSVDMMYGPAASSAYTADARNALVDYFSFDDAAQFLYASSFNSSTWSSMLRSDLDLGRPILYRGEGPEGGHAFVLDDYQGTDYFHFNWGWGGAYNGYYYLNNLNPGSHSFTEDQGAVLNLYPESIVELILNGGCEDPLIDGEIPHWTEIVGSNWTQRGTDPSAYEGDYYFYAGPGSSAELDQDINVSAYADLIDSGSQNYAFSGYVRSWHQSPADLSRIIIEYLNADKTVVLTSYDSGTHSNTSSWLQLTNNTFAPPGTRNIRIRLISVRRNGTNNDGYFDALSLKTVAPYLPQPEISGLSIVQRADESQIVDIYYDVQAPYVDKLSVYLDISDDDGVTWDIPTATASNDIGLDVISPGNGKHILWDVAEEDLGTTGGFFTFRLTASDGVVSSSIVSQPVEISLNEQTYSVYRVVPVSQAPNPAILEIPEGGTGYAWFRLEGWAEGRWQPVVHSSVEAEDAQGTIITCETRKLNYHFLNGEDAYIQDNGVFGIPIPSALIGDGQVGATETIVVVSADGHSITPLNSRSITCQVVEYEYAAHWGSRIFVRTGLGNTGPISLTGFIGGGSGAEIELPFRGTSAIPDWSNLRIRRKDDKFIGATLALEAPSLINLGSIEGTAQASFPYEKTYRLDLEDNIDDDYDALLAMYLYAEPLVALVDATPIGCYGPLCLRIMREMLVPRFPEQVLSSYRISDETGLDLEGVVSVENNMLGPTMALAAGASVSRKAHMGAAAKKYSSHYSSGRSEKTLYIGDERSVSGSAGIKVVPFFEAGVKYFYPQKLIFPDLPTLSKVDYQITGTWQNNDWVSTTLSSSFTTDNPEYNCYGLGGALQKYETCLEVKDGTCLDILNDKTGIPEQMSNIGTGYVSLVANSSTYSDEYSDFMKGVNDEQHRGNPVSLGYNLSQESLSPFNSELGLTIPIIGYPIEVIFGLGREETEYRRYLSAVGHMVNGYPYLQYEMDILPEAAVNFEQVKSSLLNKANMPSGSRDRSLWDNLADYMASQLTLTVLRPSDMKSRTTRSITLNNIGSELIMTDGAFPAGVDSVLCRYWEWGDEPVTQGLTPVQRDDIREYNRKLREIREEASNMRYGVGGFFGFKGSAPEWNEDPLIRIRYQDDEVTDLDETTLGIFWEDDSGIWHYISSTAVPDSNFVYGYLPYIATYTLAPRLPQGEITLVATPDSLLADGMSMVQVTSGILHNNDGTQVAEGQMYTVSASRGVLLAVDADPGVPGIQTASAGGIISFVLLGDQVPSPITLSAIAVEGISSGTLILPLYSSQPPEPPLLMDLLPEHRALRIEWEPSATAGVVGYCIYYDIDGPGAPYQGTSSINGFDSPIFTGSLSGSTITGLNNADLYYVAVTAIDAYGRESAPSNVMAAQPAIREIQDLAIQHMGTGVKLDWSPSFGAESYIIYRSEDPSTPIDDMVIVGQTNSLTWTDCEAGAAKSFYRIIAVGY
jgi:hypothetical protein